MNFCQQTAVLFTQNLCTLPPFWLGSIVGLACAAIGAAVEHQRVRARRGREDDENTLPGCMIMMVGALGFMGVIALLISLFTGEMRRAVLLGLGIGAGFMFGFMLLAGMWLLLARKQ